MGSRSGKSLRTVLGKKFFVPTLRVQVLGLRARVWGLGSRKSRSDAAAQEAERSQLADAGQSN